MNQQDFFLKILSMLIIPRDNLNAENLLVTLIFR